jgi:hypothetical protein
MTKRSRAIAKSLKTGVLVLSVCLVLASFGCGACRRPQSDRDLKVITVCQALENPTSLRGQMVAVRGLYYRGRLLQDDCPHPFVTDTRHWPSALAVEAASLARLGGEDVRFATDLASMDHLEGACIREGNRGSRVEIWATIVGKFAARGRYDLPGGRLVAGYGAPYGATLPAEIIVQRVTDITVKPNPASKYDYGPRRQHL